MPYHQKLVNLSRILEDWQEMNDLNIQEESTIDMIYRSPFPQTILVTDSKQKTVSVR